MMVRFTKLRRAIAAALLVSTALLGAPAYGEPLGDAAPEAAIDSPAKVAPPPALPELDLAAKEKSEANPGASDMNKIDLNYIKGYATDTGKILTSPLRWDSGDWMKVGLVLGGTSALFLVDKEIKNFAQKNKSSVSSGLADIGNAIGEPMYIFPAVGAAYLYGSLTDNPKLRRVSLLSLESLTISGAITMGLKTVAGRHRPLTGALPMNWHGPTNEGGWDSFSSGHTSNAFAVATVVANEYKGKPYVAPIAYGLATLTALARIYDNKHWASDTFFGAALGHLVSKAVLSYHKEDKSKLAKKVSIMPRVGKEMTGVTVSYKL